MSLFIVLATIVIGGCGASGSSSMSLKDLKECLDQIKSANGVITKSALFSKIGEPEKVQSVGTDVFLYYRVREGMAQVVVFAPAWEGKVPREVPVKGASPAPDRPSNLVEWYIKQGGINPFTIREQVQGGYVEVAVLKNGQPTGVKSTVKTSPENPPPESEKITHHLRNEAPATDKNMEVLRAGDPPKQQPWPDDMAGYFAIRDKTGAMIHHVKYFLPGSTPGTDSYNRGLEKSRERAKEKVEAIAADLAARHREDNHVPQETLPDARKYAQEAIQNTLNEMAASAWEQHYSEWKKKNIQVDNEPHVIVKAINQY